MRGELFRRRSAPDRQHRAHHAQGGRFADGAFLERPSEPPQGGPALPDQVLLDLRPHVRLDDGVLNGVEAGPLEGREVSRAKIGRDRIAPTRRVEQRHGRKSEAGTDVHRRPHVRNQVVPPPEEGLERFVALVA